MQAGVLQGDRGLSCEGAEQILVGLGKDFSTEAVLDVDQANPLVVYLERSTEDGTESANDDAVVLIEAVVRERVTDP